MSAPSGDAASVTVAVRASPTTAFALFTEEIDLWWGRGPKFRCGGPHASRLELEPRVGGRLTETIDHPRGARTVELGRVQAWEPPARLVLEWRGVNFAPGERTLVEVTFRAQGEGTLVTVRHSGWSTLRPDHPARHGHEGAAFSRFIGLWWGELMGSLRERAAQV